MQESVERVRAPAIVVVDQLQARVTRQPATQALATAVGVGMVSPTLKLSLVVLSFKRYDTTTGPCLATLGEALSDPRIELILVDNGSNDGTAEQCAAWAVQHPSARYEGEDWIQINAECVNPELSCVPRSRQ